METKLLGTDRPITIYYALPSEIESIVSKDANTKTVSFKAGYDWKLINTTIGTIDIKEKNAKSTGGTKYSTSIIASCPGHEIKTPTDIENVSGRRMFLRLDYRQGFKKLIGSLENAPEVFINTDSNKSTVRKLNADWDSNSVNYWLE